MSDENVYLVGVTIHLLSGHNITAVDAIEAPSVEIASNMAYNMFLRADNNSVVFGDQAFFPEAVASLSVKVLSLIDINEPDNKIWKHSVETAREFFERMKADE